MVQNVLSVKLTEYIAKKNEFNFKLPNTPNDDSKSFKKCKLSIENPRNEQISKTDSKRSLSLEELKQLAIKRGNEVKKKIMIL